MKEVTIFVADDGTKFDEQVDCEKHELVLNLRKSRLVTTDSYMTRVVPVKDLQQFLADNRETVETFYRLLD